MTSAELKVLSAELKDHPKGPFTVPSNECWVLSGESHSGLSTQDSALSLND